MCTCSSVVKGYGGFRKVPSQNSSGVKGLKSHNFLPSFLEHNSYMYTRHGDIGWQTEKRRLEKKKRLEKRRKAQMKNECTLLKKIKGTF